MKKYLSLAVIALFASSAQAEKKNLKYVDVNQPCHKQYDGPLPENIIEALIPVADIPDTFVWNDVNGKNFLTNVKQQHMPEYCGSCWAQATTSAMSDRIKIMRNGAWPDINISPQVLISCQTPDDGCDGGLPILAYDWIHNYNITDETCAIYRGRGHTNGVECSPLLKCKNCNPHTDCFIPDEYYEYTVTEYGKVIGAANMTQEIYQRGPIACGIAVTEAFEEYKGGIFNDTTLDTEIVHDISLVGFGEENGVKYWVGRNSWGTHWGENGFFKIV